MPITYCAFAGVTGAGSSTDTYLVSLLRRLGYKTTLRALQEDRFVPVTNDPRRHIQIGSGSWWADIPSASEWTQLLSCAAYDARGPEGDSNPAGFCDPAVDRLTRRRRESPEHGSQCRQSAVGPGGSPDSPTTLLGSR